jgi:outer membrane protein assembly factor BamB
MLKECEKASVPIIGKPNPAEHKYTRTILIALFLGFVVLAAISPTDLVAAEAGDVIDLKWSYRTYAPLWEAPAMYDVDGDGWLDVIIASEVSNGSHTIFCLSGQNGTVKWIKQFSSALYTTPSIGDVDNDGDNEIVIGASDMILYCLSGNTGEIQWTYTVGSTEMSPAAIGDVNDDGASEVIVGSFTGTLHCIRGTNGTVIWTYDISPSARIMSAPTIIDVDRNMKCEVYFSAWNGYVYCVDGVNGTEIWNYFTGTLNSLGIAPGDFDDDGEYEVVISAGTQVICFQSLSNATRWIFSNDMGINTYPVLSDIDGDNTEEVVIATDRFLYALSGNNGTIEWITRIGDAVFSTPVVCDFDGDWTMELLFGATNNHLYCLSGDTGVIEWSIIHGDWIANSPSLGDVDKDGIIDIVVNCLDGTVYCYGGLGPSWALPGPWSTYGGSPKHDFYFLDSDRDDIIDPLELVSGLDPSNNDTDGDYLQDNDEITFYRTDPTLVDTDSDRLVDRAECEFFHTNPRESDTDGDGMSDPWEIFYDLNPLDDDSMQDDDSDGLSNVVEFHEGTSPLSNDSDGDTMDDGWEIVNGLLPRLGYDANLDNDGDGLPNLWEYRMGYLPKSPDSDRDGTSDADEDADADGIKNGDEIRYYNDFNKKSYYSWNYRLDPMIKDSDGNGIPDGDEDFDSDGFSMQSELYVHFTNPFNVDSDSDSIPDGLDPHPNSVDFNIQFVVISLISLVSILCIASINYTIQKRKNVTMNKDLMITYAPQAKNVEITPTINVQGRKKDVTFIITFAVANIVLFSLQNSPLVWILFTTGFILIYFTFFKRIIARVQNMTQRASWRYYYYAINIYFFILIGTAIWWLASALSGSKIQFTLDNMFVAILNRNALFLIPLLAVYPAFFITLYSIINNLVLWINNKTILEYRTYFSLIFTVFIFICLYFASGFILIAFNLDMPIYLQGLFGANLSNNLATTIAFVSIPATFSQVYFSCIGACSIIFHRKKQPVKVKGKLRKIVAKLKFDVFIRFVVIIIAVFMIIRFNYDFIKFLIEPGSYSTGSAFLFVIFDGIFHLQGTPRVVWLIIIIVATLFLNFYFTYHGLAENYFKRGSGHIHIEPEKYKEKVEKEYEKSSKEDSTRDRDDFLLHFTESQTIDKRFMLKKIENLLTEDLQQSRRSVLSPPLKISIASLVLLGIGLLFCGDLWQYFTHIVVTDPPLFDFSKDPYWLHVISGVAAIAGLSVFSISYYFARRKTKEVMVKIERRLYPKTMKADTPLLKKAYAPIDVPTLDLLDRHVQNEDYVQFRQLIKQISEKPEYQYLQTLNPARLVALVKKQIQQKKIESGRQ